MSEVWKKAKGCPGHEVSDAGHLRVKRGGEWVYLTPSEDESGKYHVLSINGDAKRVALARLVLLSFGKRPKPGQVVRYVDRKRGNCSLTNLSWVSRSEAATGADRKPSVELTDEQKTSVARRLSLGGPENSLRRIAADLGCSRTTVAKYRTLGVRPKKGKKRVAAAD